MFLDPILAWPACSLIFSSVFLCVCRSICLYFRLSPCVSVCVCLYTVVCFSVPCSFPFAEAGRATTTLTAFLQERDEGDDMIKMRFQQLLKMMEKTKKDFADTAAKLNGEINDEIQVFHA